MKRAPLWFTHGKVRDRVHRFWPYALGLALGGMYYVQPEPFEEVRVATLAAVRRPVLKSSEWLELRDVDPESAALELPPDQIFGPLTLKQQMVFLMEALRNDNELADGYVTRMLIDMMDMSLDPAVNGDLFVECGAKDLVDFAVADFYELRPGGRHKFFNADQLLRLINCCANNYELVDHLIQKHDGVNLIFRAAGEARNEYSRIFAMRSLTLFAFLQPVDGEVEKQIVSQRHLRRIVDFYRSSTGDPTDTRFLTMVISSSLRLYPLQAYTQLMEADLPAAVVANLNIARYKGLPQHLRLAKDLIAVRQFLAKRNALPDAAAIAAVAVPTPIALPPLAEVKADEGEAIPLITPKLLSANPAQPIQQALYNSDFVPVSLGVMDMFGEYLESTEQIVSLLTEMKNYTSPWELLEYRLLSVSSKLLAKLDHRDDFLLGDARKQLLSLCLWVMDDPECSKAISTKAVGGDTFMAADTIRRAIAAMHQREQQPQHSSVVPASSGAAVHA